MGIVAIRAGLVEAKVDQLAGVVHVTRATRPASQAIPWAQVPCGLKSGFLSNFFAIFVVSLDPDAAASVAHKPGWCPKLS